MAGTAIILCVPHLAHSLLRHPVLICELQAVERAASHKQPFSVGTGPQHVQHLRPE